MQSTILLESDLSQTQFDLVLDMVEETRHVPGDIIEIGSWKCGTSGVMAARNPEKIVYAFDIFGGMPPGVKDGPPWDFFAGTDWEEIQRTAACIKNLRLVRGQHETTVPAFAKFQRPISLLFMDSDHYPSHRVSLEQLAPLVSREGVIVFHDWTFPEVQQAVNETIDKSEWKMLDGRDMDHMGILRKN